MVDGNVIRVIARLRAISANPKDSVTVKKLWWAIMTPTTFLLVFIFYYGTRFIVIFLDTILLTFFIRPIYNVLSLDLLFSIV